MPVIETSMVEPMVRSVTEAKTPRVNPSPKFISSFFVLVLSKAGRKIKKLAVPIPAIIMSGTVEVKGSIILQTTDRILKLI